MLVQTILRSFTQRKFDQNQTSTVTIYGNLHHKKSFIQLQTLIEQTTQPALVKKIIFSFIQNMKENMSFFIYVNIFFTQGIVWADVNCSAGKFKKMLQAICTVIMSRTEMFVSADKTLKNRNYCQVGLFPWWVLKWLHWRVCMCVCLCAASREKSPQLKPFRRALSAWIGPETVLYQKIWRR